MKIEFDSNAISSEEIRRIAKMLNDIADAKDKAEKIQEEMHKEIGI